MSSFVATEFECSHWQTIFLEKAKAEFIERQKHKEQQKTLKLKLQNQEINTIKNKLVATKMKEVVPQLVTKGKQFSTLTTELLPQYDEYIRLSVHCDREVINVSHKIPISLIYGHLGTPWHNTIVINQANNGCSLFKDTFRKKDSFAHKQICRFDMPTQHNQIMSLQYIIKENLHEQ